MEKVFPEAAMTIAAIDKLVHHSTITEMNVESYRQRSATKRKARAQTPASTPSASTSAPTHQHRRPLPAAITRDNHPAKRDRTTILIATQTHPDRRATGLLCGSLWHLARLRRVLGEIAADWRITGVNSKNKNK